MTRNPSHLICVRHEYVIPTFSGILSSSPARFEDFQGQIARRFKYGIGHQKNHHCDCVLVVRDVVAFQKGIIG